MRKLIIGCALAASALTIAVPAAAQYYPQQQTYGSNQGYNQGYNQNYGYNQNNRGDARVLIARVDQVRQQIRQLGRSGALSRQEAYRLDAEAQQLRNQVRQSAYNGVDQREQWQLQRQIQRLEQRVSRNATDRNGRYGRGSGFGNQNQYGQQNGNWQNRDGDRRDGDRNERDND